MSNAKSDPLNSPIPLKHLAIDDLDLLRSRLQSAVQLELTTIPPYLCALYSIIDKTSDAYQALRSVVIEEMFHLNQAANLLIAVGGKPKLTGAAAPEYPTYLPSASRTETAYVGLYRASLQVFKNVFMAIEMPAPYEAPAEGQNYKTIGQFYKAIEQGLEYCVEKYGAAKVFHQASGVRQRSDIYLGKFGGQVVTVSDLKSAKFAIRQIMEQGEGAVDPTRVLVPDQPFGAYNYYGRRIDGTYGPILGTPFELSHYFKFKRVADSDKFPDTYPIVSNPRVADITNAATKKLAVTFNKYYSIVLKSMEQSFLPPRNEHDVYFEVALPLMHNHLPQLAQQLMTSLVVSDGDPSVGPNAAPAFEYDSEAKISDIIDALDAMTGDGDTVRATHARVAETAHLVGRFAERPIISRFAVPNRLAVVPTFATRKHPVFDRLADNLRQIQKVAQRAGRGL
jgi:Ferritin-like